MQAPSAIICFITLLWVPTKYTATHFEYKAKKKVVIVQTVEINPEWTDKKKGSRVGVHMEEKL